MAWVEVEEDGKLAMVVAVIVGGAAAIPVWRHTGFWSGLLAFYAAGTCGMLVYGFVRMLLLPTKARTTAKRVRNWFGEQFPNLRILSVAVRAIEPERYVIAVRYEAPQTRSYPTARRYFAVSGAGGDDVVELPHEDWWPRGLK